MSEHGDEKKEEQPPQQPIGFKVPQDHQQATYSQVMPMQPGYPAYNTTSYPGPNPPPAYSAANNPVYGPVGVAGQPVVQPGAPNAVYYTQAGPQYYQPGQIVIQAPVIDPKTEKMRTAALAVSITSLFCGLICCSIPAIVFAIRRPPHGTYKDYKTSIILGSVAIGLGIAWVIAIIAVYASAAAALAGTGNAIMSSSMSCYSFQVSSACYYSYTYSCYRC